MAQEEITIVRLHKSTRDKLRRLAIASRESYDEIINRLLGSETIENNDELKKRKERLLKMGISKQLVDLVGILPKNDVKQDKELIREGIERWAKQKGTMQ